MASGRVPKTIRILRLIDNTRLGRGNRNTFALQSATPHPFGTQSTAPAAAIWHRLGRITSPKVVASLRLCQACGRRDAFGPQTIVCGDEGSYGQVAGREDRECQ